MRIVVTFLLSTWFILNGLHLEEIIASTVEASINSVVLNRVVSTLSLGPSSDSLCVVWQVLSFALLSWVEKLVGLVNCVVLSVNINGLVGVFLDIFVDFIWVPFSVSNVIIWSQNTP